MKVLRLNHNAFIWLGICRDDQAGGRLQLWRYILGWMLLFTMGSTFKTGLSYTIGFIDVNLDHALHAAFMSIGYFVVTIILLSMGLFRDRIASIFDRLQNLYDKSEFH